MAAKSLITFLKSHNVGTHTFEELLKLKRVELGGVFTHHEIPDKAKQATIQNMGKILSRDTRPYLFGFQDGKPEIKPFTTNIYGRSLNITNPNEALCVAATALFGDQIQDAGELTYYMVFLGQLMRNMGYPSEVIHASYKQGLKKLIWYPSATVGVESLSISTPVITPSLPSNPTRPHELTEAERKLIASLRKSAKEQHKLPWELLISEEDWSKFGVKTPDQASELQDKLLLPSLKNAAFSYNHTALGEAFPLIHIPEGSIDEGRCLQKFGHCAETLAWIYIQMESGSLADWYGISLKAREVATLGEDVTAAQCLEKFSKDLCANCQWLLNQAKGNPSKFYDAKWPVEKWLKDPFTRPT